ncbi:MAG: NAD-dependent epimerase/dehydratase family protein [Deltaproteobacteria bacterium]|nr:NAD-dependent epimerase/dehydratase family protein [Deltaproteobacteria bacterium]
MFYQGKKVLVTGGSGFVGTHILQELLKEGASVRVPIHERPLVIQDDQIEVMNADLTRREDCLRATKDIDYVFHAAGAVAAAGVNTSNPMAAITTNLILNAQMLQAAWDSGVERFLLFGSSTGYPVADYAIREEEMWNGPTHPTYFGYGWMRRYLERLAEFVGSKSTMKMAIVRPSAVYGRHDNFDPAASHVIPALIRRAVEKEDPYVVWGTGDEVRDFLHISDLARGCLLVLEKYAECDAVNLGYGKVVTIKEIVQMVLKAAGHHNAKIIFDSTKPTTIPFRMIDTAKAERLLGFNPTISLEKGITDTIEWYLSTQA